MEADKEFLYCRRPALISLTPALALCAVAALLLYSNDPLITDAVKNKVLAPTSMPTDNVTWRLPYGPLLALPVFAYFLNLTLWGLLSYYEITPHNIRLVSGSVVRRESYYSLDEFDDVGFSQSIVEVPFGIGQLVLHSSHRQLKLQGIHNVKSVVDTLRHHLRQRPPVPQQSSAYAHGTHAPAYSNPVTTAVDSVQGSNAPQVIVHKGGGAVGCLIILLIAVLLITVTPLGCCVLPFL